MRIKTRADRRERIQLRQRKRIAGTAERPRLTSAANGETLLAFRRFGQPDSNAWLGQIALAQRLVDLSAWLAERPEHQRGEFVLVVHDQPVAASRGEGERILRCLLTELPVKTAVKLAAEISGEPRNALYERALALKQG